MKVGSLVICPNGHPVNNEEALQLGAKAVPSSGDIVYTVRSFFANYGMGFLIHLEEIKNPINPSSGREYGYEASRFREIQPPLDLTELLEETLLETA